MALPFGETVTAQPCAARPPAPGSPLRSRQGYEMRPFTLAWDADRLAWLHDRFAAYRTPRLPEGAGWRYGCDPDCLAGLVAYWRDGFDVEAAAAELNRFPHAMARIEDLDIHVVHVVGEARGRRPPSSPMAGRARSTSSGTLSSRWPSPRATGAGRRTRSTWWCLRCRASAFRQADGAPRPAHDRAAVRQADARGTGLSALSRAGR